MAIHTTVTAVLSMSTPPSFTSKPGLPLVVQVAFSGSRVLLSPEDANRVDPATFEKALVEKLAARLSQIPDDLHLSSAHHPVGISSLACGADTVFGSALKEVKWPLRVFLPQARSEFFSAGGKNGPDFTSAQRQQAETILNGDYVIEERVASTSSSRHTRFEDVNLELVRVCDVVVCLEGVSAGQPGGTHDVLALAQRRHRPALSLRLTLDADGQPELSGDWRWNPPPHLPAEAPSGFSPPTLPAPLNEIACADCDFGNAKFYRDTLKKFSSDKASERQSFFARAALIIVGTHVTATALALRAVQDNNPHVVPWLLGLELVLLLGGLIYHQLLHHSHAAQSWATARLAAEIARSAIPLSAVPRALQHLFDLPMPLSLRPLLRTLNVLQLRDSKTLSSADWTQRRDGYVMDRLTKPKSGQRDYYQVKLAKAKRWLSFAKYTFIVGSIGALAATSVKLYSYLHAHGDHSDHPAYLPVLGFLAVLLPILAVAGLSLAAAFDLEARVHTYEDMLAFLEKQIPLLDSVKTENEFAKLALETESRLLGETANWYARRAFTGVA